MHPRNALYRRDKLALRLDQSDPSGNGKKDRRDGHADRPGDGAADPCQAGSQSCLEQGEQA